MLHRYQNQRKIQLQRSCIIQSYSVSNKQQKTKSYVKSYPSCITNYSCTICDALATMCLYVRCTVNSTKCFFFYFLMHIRHSIKRCIIHCTRNKPVYPFTISTNDDVYCGAFTFHQRPESNSFSHCVPMN